MTKDDEGTVEYPPGWKTWGAAKQRDWEHGLERAKNTIKRHGQEKVESALLPLDTMARKGVPLEDAQNAAITLLDRGAVLSDFEPLGKFVIAKNQQGLKGKELIEVIGQEIKRLKAEREELLKKAKEKKDTKTDTSPPKSDPPPLADPEKDKDKEKSKDKPKEKTIPDGTSLIEARSVTIEYPPGWATWDKVKQQDWELGLERAKDTVRKHEQDKVESVLCTLDTMARKGVLLEDVQNAVITLLDQGADTSDYYPLYRFIIEENQEGIKGKELIEDIIQEIKRLKARHEELLKKAKEKKDNGSPPEKDKDK